MIVLNYSLGFPNIFNSIYLYHLFIDIDLQYGYKADMVVPPGDHIQTDLSQSAKKCSAPGPDPVVCALGLDNFDTTLS